MSSLLDILLNLLNPPSLMQLQLLRFFLHLTGSNTNNDAEAFFPPCKLEPWLVMWIITLLNLAGQTRKQKLLIKTSVFPQGFRVNKQLNIQRHNLSKTLVQFLFLIDIKENYFLHIQLQITFSNTVTNQNKTSIFSVNPAQQSFI